MASKRAMRRRVGLAAFVLVGVLAACGGTDVGEGVAVGSGEGSTTPPTTVQAPSGEPSVVGTATKVTGTTFVVQDGKDPRGAALAASIRVPASASVLRTSGSGYTKASVDQLRDGASVKVWFTGPVAESYPVQATAGTIVITG
jgi:hypothetical protein